MHCTKRDLLANLLNDEHSQETISDHVDAVVDLARAEQNGSRGHELGLHVFAELQEQRLLKVAKGSGYVREEVCEGGV